MQHQPSTARRLIATLAVVVVLLGTAPHARAQLTEAGAVKKLKHAMKALELTADAKMDSARDTWSDAIDAIDDVVKAGDFTPPVVEDVFDATATLDLALAQISYDLGADVYHAVEPVLAEFAAGSTLNGVFPAAFYTGSGGPVDALQATVQRRIDKTVALARKRLSKLGASIEKHAGCSLTFLLQAPPPSLSQGRYDETLGSNLGIWAFPITVDLVIASSSLANAADGVIYAGGLGEPEYLNVYAPVHPGEPVYDASSNSWKTRIDNDGAGLPEGIYPLTIELVDDEADGIAWYRTVCSIGVR